MAHNDVITEGDTEDSAGLSDLAREALVGVGRIGSPLG